MRKGSREPLNILEQRSENKTSDSSKVIERQMRHIGLKEGEQILGHIKVPRLTPGLACPSEFPSQA